MKPGSLAESVGDCIEEQRAELFKAMGIVECCKHAGEHALQSTGEGPDIPAALEAAHALLNRVAGMLGELADSFKRDDRGRTTQNAVFDFRNTPPRKRPPTELVSG